MELDQLLAQINTAIQNSQGAAASLQGAMGAQIGAQGRQAQAIAQAGEASEVIANQEARGALQAQQGSRAFATSAGTNMASQAEIMTLLGTQMKQAALEIPAKQARVAEFERNATLANPLGLLADIFFGDQARAELQASQMQLKQASDAIQSLNAASQTVAQTQKAIAETESEATVAARLKLVQAETQRQIAGIQEKQASTNASLISALDSMNRQQLSMIIQGHQLQADYENRMYMREERQAQRELRAAEKMADEQLIEVANRGLQFMGKAPVSSRQSLTTVYSRDDVARAIQFGQQLSQPDPQVTFGGSPVEAISVLRENPAIQVPEVQAPVQQWLESSWENLNPDQIVLAGMAKNSQEANMQLQEARKSPAKMADFLNSFLRNKATQEAQNLKLGDTTNLYSLPPMDVLNPDAEWFKGNKFLEEIVQPAVRAGSVGVFDPARFVELGMEKYSPTEVADGLATVANALYAKGPMLRNLKAFGLPELTKYQTQVSVPWSTEAYKRGDLRARAANMAAFGQAQTGVFSRAINILDPADWNQFLAELEARKTAKGLGSTIWGRIADLSNVNYAPPGAGSN